MDYLLNRRILFCVVFNSFLRLTEKEGHENSAAVAAASVIFSVGSKISGISITWRLVRNANPGPRNLCIKKTSRWCWCILKVSKSLVYIWSLLEAGFFFFIMMSYWFASLFLSRPNLFIHSVHMSWSIYLILYFKSFVLQDNVKPHKIHPNCS